MAAPAIPGLDGSGQSGLRYERKFRPGRDVAATELRLRLHPFLFRPLYAPRDVHNLYYDHPDRRLLRQGRDGVSVRRKVRIRWYDGDLASPTLEIKGRTGQLGWKVSHRLPALTDADLRRPLHELLDGVPAPLVESLRGLQPTLANRYRRSYWQSRNGDFRATIDQSLRFGRPHRAMALDPLGGELVLELKYADSAAGDEAAVVGPLGLRVGRFSKYSVGCELLGIV